MCEIEDTVHLMTKLYIMVNAVKLGWMVEIDGNKIILTKDLNSLTRLDKNTPKLIELLVGDSWMDDY